MQKKITYKYRLKRIKLYMEDWYDYVVYINKSLQKIFSEYFLLESKITVVDNHPCLHASFAEIHGNIFYLKIIADISPSIEIQYYGDISGKIDVEKILDKIEDKTLAYIDQKGVGIIHFIFVPGQKFSLTTKKPFVKRALEKIVFNNVVFSIILSLILFFLLSSFLGSLLALFLTMPLISFPLTIFSNKILEAIGDWEITQFYRYVYIVSLKVPLRDYPLIYKKIFLRKDRIKKAIYINTLFSQDDDLKYKILTYLSKKIGVHISKENISIKKLDLYSLVDSVFLRFGLSTPRIKVLNTKYPNAMVSGILSNQLTLLITSGLLINLNESEIYAIIGHEASHVKNHDQLFFLIIGSLEYLVRAYVFLILGTISFIIKLIYFISSMTILFLSAKMVEIRADLESSFLLNTQINLASALRKIYLNHNHISEKENGVIEWFLWKPHPPIISRIKILLSMNSCHDNLFLTVVRHCLKSIIRTSSL